MTAQMKEYAKNLAFEEAGKIRDRINSLDKLFSKQSVTNISDERNIDVFYKHSLSGVTGITQIFVRSGRMIGVSTHFFCRYRRRTFRKVCYAVLFKYKAVPRIYCYGGGRI